MQQLETTITVSKFQIQGALMALKSPENTSGFEQIDLQDKQGRTQTTQVRYTAGLPLAQATNARTNICTAGDRETELFSNITTNYVREIKLTLNDADFEAFCATQSSMRDELTRKKLNALYAAVNSDIVTELAANFGNHWSTGVNTPVQVPLIDTDGGANYWGEMEILNEFEDMETLGRPILISTGRLREYAKLTKIACCNDRGQNLDNAADFAYYRDGQVDQTIAATSNIIALAPGASQLITRNNFVGQFEKFDGNNAKTTVTDPVSGLSLDMSVFYNWCENPDDQDATARSTWVITWSLDFGIFTIPTDLMPVGSDWEGVNGILHFQGTCGDANVCDSGS